VVDSTIARGGETPVAWRSVCVAGWQPKIIVQSVGAKGERVHYLSLLSRQLLPTELISWSAMSVGVIDRSINSRNTCYCPSGNQSHLGHLDFCEERHGDGANFCVFIAEKDGESE
jgi:hypothetical protein